MKREYNKLFSVETIHEYYTDLDSDDFLFYPTHQTSQLLSGYGLLLTTSDYGFEVLYPASHGESDPFIKIDDWVNFSFVVTLKNSHFFNFSNVPEDNQSAFYLTNHKQQKTQNELPLDESKLRQGNYLKRYYESKQHLETLFPEVKEILSSNSFFGIIDLSVKELLEKEQHYYLAFESKRAIWKYDIFLDKDRNNSKFTIEDKGNKPDNRYGGIYASFVQTKKDVLSNGKKVLHFESAIANYTGVYDTANNALIGKDIPALITEPKKVSKPIFSQKTAKCVRDLYVRKNSRKSTNYEFFRNIKVSENSTLTFNAACVSIYKLVCEGKGAKIEFKNNCKLYIREQLILEQGSVFNSVENEVICLIGKKTTRPDSTTMVVEAEVQFTATVFTFGKLEIKPGRHHHHYPHHHHDHDDDDDDDNHKIYHHKHHNEPSDAVMKGVFIIGNLSGSNNVIWELKKNTWDVPVNDKVEPLEIPYYEESKSSLQLIKRVNQEGDTANPRVPGVENILIENLPNPAISNPKSEVFIHL